MKSKKGDGMPIGVVIGFILLLLVLLVVVIIFMSQSGFAFKSFGQSFKHIFTLLKETKLNLK